MNIFAYLVFGGLLLALGLILGYYGQASEAALVIGFDLGFLLFASPSPQEIEDYYRSKIIIEN